jgi:hypothetical protein
MPHLRQGDPPLLCTPELQSPDQIHLAPHTNSLATYILPSLQVLRTYEGRRLHEKLQHVAKLNPEAGPVVPKVVDLFLFSYSPSPSFISLSKVEEQAEEQPEGHMELRLRDSKQILMDHLKAAGLDPSILDSSNINAEEDEDFGQEAGMASNTNESFDNEDDEDDDDDDDDEEESNEAPASSSSGIEEQQSEHS